MGLTRLQLTEAGIPAWQILADKMKISTAEVMKMSEKGLIPADKAIKVLIDGMNTRFPDMMEEMAHTTQGLFDKMKDTFNNKLLVRFGDGIGKALKPKFEQISLWIDKNGVTIKRWGDSLERVASWATNVLISKVERGFKYIKSILDDPKLGDLNSIPDKLSFVWEKLVGDWNLYWESTGKKNLSDMLKNAVTFAANAVKKALPDILPILTDVGIELGKGLLNGLRKAISSDPRLAAIIGGVTGNAIAGPLGGVLGSGFGVAQYAMDQLTGTPTLFGNAPPGSSILGYSGGAKVPGTEKIFQVGNTIRDAFTTPGNWKSNLKATSDSVIHSHHEGIGSVPYNGYRTTLHKDERVLTKSENAEYSSGKIGFAGAPTINITVNGGVRSDKDIDAIAMALARGLEGLQGAKPQ